MGVEALELLKRHSVALILLDSTMHSSHRVRRTGPRSRWIKRPHAHWSLPGPGQPTRAAASGACRLALSV
jgi:hypothetical protein